MTIILGADHRGFFLKEHVKQILTEPWIDCSQPQYDPEDDYCDIAARAVVQLKHDSDRAILFCGSGHGMDITANRFPHIRAIMGFNEEVVIQGRQHEDANVLIIPSDWTSETAAEKLVDLFLTTSASTESRHLRRRQKLNSLSTKL